MLVPTQWGSPTFEIDGVKMLLTATLPSDLVEAMKRLRRLSVALSFAASFVAAASFQSVACAYGCEDCDRWICPLL